MSSDPFRVLAVCTGNICRSPATELLLAAGLSDDPRFDVSSAGTHAMAGWPISPPMDELLADLGIPSDRFTARQATRSLLAGSDLILTATREHREWVVGEQPRALRRVFTLTEFADAVRDHGDTSGTRGMSAAELVAWAAANRPSARIADLGSVTRRGYLEGDILDPYGRGRAAYHASLAQIEPLTASIGRALRASR
ncbi:arsenate reductase/protein-tyrosine-phosphatase family protein [Leifsonia poae]|uniref:Low molecular weight phosphatase family protein n=1 Tax=Leifsonia poae TaxID=110933 RepID=A0A9W6LZ02_9MICO|nr:hypothetical protein [Leifsonia poae]GLJ75405.1 low molecular weight phosphatase family protein [Leifsonia poae]